MVSTYAIYKSVITNIGRHGEEQGRERKERKKKITSKNQEEVVLFGLI